MQSYDQIFTEDKMATNKDGGNYSMILCEIEIPNEFRFNIIAVDRLHRLLNSENYHSK